MGKLIIILFFCTFSLQIVNASDSTLQLTLTKKITGNYKNFEVDNLGNIYLVSNDNQIKKINNNFDSIATFNDTKRYGNISLIDVTNPLKILVYYKDFATILELDRFFNIINTLDLHKQNLTEINLIASSYDNNIWLFDEVNYKLKKIDDLGNVLSETVDIRMLFDADNYFPMSFLKDNNKEIYLYNKQNGLIVFDYYGGLKHHYSIPVLSNLQLEKNGLTGLDSDNTIQQYDLLLMKSCKINSNIIFSAATKFFCNFYYTYVLNREGIRIYSKK